MRPQTLFCAVLRRDIAAILAKIETFELYTTYGREEVISIRDPDARRGFQEVLGQHVDEALLNRAFIYGHLA